MVNDDLTTRPCIGALEWGELVRSWTVHDYDDRAGKTVGIPRAPKVESLTTEPQSGVYLGSRGRTHAEFVITDRAAYDVQMKKLLGLL